ncbi:DEAD/DEAH box helicase family protein [Planktothrix sp. FACHB-1365]|uniref:DEAD/DEAH box helicase family protein n=1 Tax=Planktothrix sp. FACHB-1365 TaxID=2692855 RepID=UPI00168235C8|nr:DEAD/DEAH box helicase family protein [Planktothrix sp. FACHB-1365]MBD2485188.1 DEAD/DEAH box helicase family protein [Planktothrix sp. FACHB-1365]
MSSKTNIDQLIINSPYEEPKQYWHYDRTSRLFSLAEGRRPAGYIIASESSKTFDDPGKFVEIPLVNQIRPRVKAWCNEGHPGVTGVTKRLLEHWHNSEERDFPFFFCQLEAIETLIWLTESPPSEKVGIDIASDGGNFQRLCCKMATGSGKTIVMSMLIAWQIINKVTYPQDSRFSKAIFVVAPGLTVKNRRQVLIPSAENNYYEIFNIVPLGLFDKLLQGKVLIRNWHALNWETEEQIAKKKSVDKRGAKSNEAYARDVLGELANSSNIVVINDEAHHAWRIAAESKVKGVSWKGNREYLLAKLIRLVEEFVHSDLIEITPPLFNRDEIRRRILLTLNLRKVVQHIWNAIYLDNTEVVEPVFDPVHPIRSTGDMRSWYTGKPCEYTRKSHINCCIFDSTWEASEAYELDRERNNHIVDAWVKNDHLGFEILYIFEGVVRKYRPDFIIRLKTGNFLILEIKGQPTRQDEAKWGFLDQWIKAVNQHGGFGYWQRAISTNPSDVRLILETATLQLA